MDGVDIADGAGLGAHDQRAGSSAGIAVGNAAQHVTIGHAGGGEVAVFRGD